MRRILTLMLAVLCAVTTAALAGTETGSFNTGSTLTVSQVTCPTLTSAAAVAVTSRPGASSGSNIAGALFTTGGGLGTGNAVSGDWLVTDGFILASGATVQTGYDRDRISGKTTVSGAPGTSGTVIPLISYSTVSTSNIGGMIRGTVDVQDATPHAASVFFRLSWAAQNVAGTVTGAAGTAEVVVSSTAVFTALTTTVTAVVSGTAVVLKITPTWTAGTPTIVRATWRGESYGPTTGTVQ